MKIACVLHDEERILDVARDANHYIIREWEGGQRQEIRLNEHEASRVVEVIMEMQRERRLTEKSPAAEELQFEHARPFGMKRY
jgi:hypothetical protein